MALTTRTTLGPVRRLAMVLTVSVVAGLGSVAIAPAASADDSDGVAAVVEDSKDEEMDALGDGDKVKDGPSSVIHRSGHRGPDAFIIMEHGRKPVFFCDLEHRKKRHNNCTRPVSGSVPRF